MVFANGWTCQVCWKPNRPQDPECYRCKTPRGLTEAEAVERRKALAARAEKPEIVPDLVVAFPVVIFRGYAKAWRRGGLVFVFGIGLSIIGVIGSIAAFQVLAPGLIHPTTVRWGSVIVFGGAGVAAASGLVLLIIRRDRLTSG